MIEEILNLIFRQVNPIKLVSRLTKLKRINSRWHNFDQISRIVIMNKLARLKICTFFNKYCNKKYTILRTLSLFFLLNPEIKLRKEERTQRNMYIDYKGRAQQ